MKPQTIFVLQALYSVTCLQKKKSVKFVLQKHSTHCLYSFQMSEYVHVYNCCALYLMLFTLGCVLELDSLSSNRCTTFAAVHESEIQLAIIDYSQPPDNKQIGHCSSERFVSILGYVL